MAIKRRSLGRNLEALLGDVTKLAKSVDTPIEGELRHLPLDQLQGGKYQPRKEFSEQSLQELAESIRAQGIIQPIIVRSVANGRYEIIAGERRFRAAQKAGLETIPVLIRELPDEAALAMALIENIQREDLNPIEEAMALKRLADEFVMTHEQIANVVGKSRATVTNLLRLLSLNPEIKSLLETGKLEMGHARALLGLSLAQQQQAADLIVTKNLSVRETEDLVRRWHNQPDQPANKKLGLAPELFELQEQFTRVLGAKVIIQQNAKGRGKITIRYKNGKQLTDILAKVNLS